jgi:hypothetical protein
MPGDSTGSISQIRHHWDQIGYISEPYDKKCMAVTVNKGMALWNSRRTTDGVEPRNAEF